MGKYLFRCSDIPMGQWREGTSVGAEMSWISVRLILGGEQST